MTFVDDFAQIFVTAMGVVVALSWHEAIKTTFDLYIRKRVEKSKVSYQITVLPHFVYAISVTLLLMWFTKSK